MAARLQALFLFLIVLAVPVLLISSNLRCVINDEALYRFEFDRHEISAETSIPKEELAEVASGLVRYFNNSSHDPSRITATVDGERRPLFNQTEMLHLRDVRGLVRLDYRVQEGSLAFILVGVAAVYAWRRRSPLSSLVRALTVGAGLGAGLMVGLSVGTLAGFDRLFEDFHLLSFSNDLWRLDPAEDYLIRIFPEEFFLEMTGLVGLATFLEALVLAALGAVYLRGVRRRAPAEAGRDASGRLARG